MNCFNLEHATRVVPKQPKKGSTVYETQNFIAVLQIFRSLTQPKARWIQFINLHPIFEAASGLLIITVAAKIVS
jgi:hypothetical protein